MPTVIRTTLMRILPDAVVRRMVEFRDSRRLRALPRQTIDVGRLRRLTSSDVESWLRDDRIVAAWTSDHERIASVFEPRDVGDAVNPGDRRALYHLVAATRPQHVLEIGTNIGGSTLVMAQALASQAGPNARLTTLDIIDVNDHAERAARGLHAPRTPRENLSLLGLEDRVSFVCQPSLRFMGSTDERFDFVLVDGDHAAPSVYQDVSASAAVLETGGVVVLHDYYPEGRDLFGDKQVISGPYLALRRMSSENPELAVLPLGALPWHTKRGSSMTTLAVLTSR